MKSELPLQIDPRRAEAVVRELLARGPAYLPGWLPNLRGADAALPWVFARYLEAVILRLNQAPAKHKLAFLEMLGIEPLAAQAARVPMVFKLAETAPETFAEAGAPIAAAPPPGVTQRIVFETEQRVGLTAGRIDRLISLWAGRDQYIDHSAALKAGQPVRLFEKRQLKDTPHILYISHNRLMALDGEARLKVEFNMRQGGSEHMNIRWEYWDGKLWRGFMNQHPECLETDQPNPDSTSGLRQSGTVLLACDCASAKPVAVNGYEGYWVRGVLDEPLPPDPALVLPLVDQLKISTEIMHLDPLVMQAVSGEAISKGAGSSESIEDIVQSEPSGPESTTWLAPDQALFLTLPVDTSQTFFPLGMAPKPGDCFYLASEEIFTKPGANAIIGISLAETPNDQFNITGGGVSGDNNELTPEVRWEYWNGLRWKDLAVVSVVSLDPGKQPSHFQTGGLIRFTVPDDFEKTSVGGKDGYWVRAYLAEGGYGFTATVTWNDGDTPSNTYTYFINKPPALRAFRLGYSWKYGPYTPEKVFAYNNFEYTDYTEAARWPGTVFPPYQLLKDVTPAVYLGLTRPLPVENANLFFDITENSNELQGPALAWEYWDGFNWEPLTARDETNALRVPGMVGLIGPEDARAQARFESALYWLRGRMKEDGPPGAPEVKAIHLNAVWAVQRQTIRDEPLGTSTGLPDQVFQFRTVPILPGEEIEVREAAGQRANVEWRIIAMEVLGSDYSIIQTLEDLLRQEGPQADIAQGDLRLRRDRNKRVTEVWVRWHGMENLLSSTGSDRHYTLSHPLGLMRLGDNQHGKVPPLGAAIQARRFQTGGGSQGNLPAGKINQPMVAINGLQSATNVLPAEGGADGEDLTQVALRGPSSLRSRGRALAAVDYETLAREASPAVAVARALPGQDPSNRPRPGWLTLVILPNSEDPRPWPSYGLRQHVLRYLSERAPASLTLAEQIYVTGPEYQPVDVSLRTRVIEPSAAGQVESDLRRALERFFHPLHGGPEGHGWEPGRAVYLSDVAAVVERVRGVDYVRDLALLLNGGLQGEHVRIPSGAMAVAGTIRIQIEA